MPDTCRDTYIWYTTHGRSSSFCMIMFYALMLDLTVMPYGMTATTHLASIIFINPWPHLTASCQHTVCRNGESPIQPSHHIVSIWTYTHKQTSLMHYLSYKLSKTNVVSFRSCTPNNTHTKNFMIKTWKQSWLLVQ